jgi:hypothetical protein
VIELDVRSYPSFECSRPRCRCGLRWSCSSVCLN